MLMRRRAVLIRAGRRGSLCAAARGVNSRSLSPFGDTNFGRKRVPLPQPTTKGETYGSADTGHARHLGKRDAGLRRNREKGWFTQPVS
jgi:hypothetical protein